MKQFEEFEAMVPDNFAQLMVQFWRDSEDLNECDVLFLYHTEDFDRLAKRISGTKCTFKPDLGYTDESINGTQCFEKEDDNFVIPVDILEIITP